MALGAALVAWLGLAACAAPERTRPAAGGPDPVEDVPADSVVVDEGDDSPEGLALAEAEQAWVDGDYRVAIAATDSLTRAWTRRPGLDERPVRRLARLLLVRAEDPMAVDLLLYHPDALDESWREEMRAAAERMSVQELEDLSRRISRDAGALGIVRAELARALALAGDDEAARQRARDLEGEELHDRDRRKVEDVLSGRVAPVTPRIRIGFVVPRSGAFVGVGDQILEGARLAARRFEAETGVPIELDVVDETRAIDSASVHLDAMLAAGAFRRPGRDTVTQTDEQGRPVLQPGRVGGAPPSGSLAAVIGPVRSEGLRAAAAARATPGLLLLSPVASEDSVLPPHAYSLWDRARRDSSEAAALANWMVSELGASRVGALYPDNESGRERTRVFRGVAEAAGFEWVGAEAYAPDSTTYEEQIRALTEADPDILYAIADGPRQVLQLAPQLHFYGLRGRITVVNQDWTHPVVLRRLDEPFSEYRVAAVYFERQENAAWREFAAAWDEEYRRSLPENAFAALGYDAVSLVVRSVPDALARPASVARAFTRLREAQGVTGRFSFDAGLGRPVRATTVRMILNSELVDPDPQAIVDWSTETREIEEQRLEREAADEARRQQRIP